MSPQPGAPGQSGLRPEAAGPGRETSERKGLERPGPGLPAHGAPIPPEASGASEVERLARAALTRIMEPQDATGLALVRLLGAEAAMDRISAPGAPDRNLEAGVRDVLEEHGAGASWKGLAPALARWQPRLQSLAPARDLHVAERLGGGLLVPGDQAWPGQFDDLGLQAPLALWYRGQVDSLPGKEQAIALVGSRDSTSYGATMAGGMAHELAQRGRTVVSGGAYGIDAHAHRAALAGHDSGVPGPPTIAFMAGGIDRYYPSGNEELLRTVAGRGAVLAEVPPGCAPTRFRFLQRNRMIAAFSGATVVVEARWRSGALNTAHHAESLGRAVAAVPGPVHSANSAGCHRLIRDGGAVLVTDAQEVLELLDGPAAEETGPERTADRRIQDGLTLEDLILLDALPLRRTTTLEKLGVVAGLDSRGVRAGLGRLQLLGLAESVGAQWKRGTAEL